MKIVKFTQRDGFTDIDVDTVMTWRETQTEDDALAESGFVHVDDIDAQGRLPPGCDNFIGRWKIFRNDAGHHYFTYDDGIDASDILFCENHSDAFALKLRLRADMQARNLSVGAREISMFMRRFFLHWLDETDTSDLHDFDEPCRTCETDQETVERQLMDKQKRAASG